MREERDLDKNEICSRLQSIANRPSSYVFEVYLASKTDPRLRRLSLSRENLHNNLKDAVIGVIKDKYLADDAIYHKVRKS